MTNKEQFEAKLNEVYGGTIKPLTGYVNENAVMVFDCSKCFIKFFGRPSYMVGKQHQQHVCNMPYSNTYGERVAYSVSKHRIKASKRDNQVILNTVNEMIWNDCTYQEIAKELKVNPNIIKDYFISEGLIACQN